MGNEIKVTMRKLAELVPYENNPRDNSKAVNAVAESIREFGFKNPIIVDKKGCIVAGHTRLKAAEKLGLDEVPVIVADDLSDEQIKAFRLADNKTAELAEWNFDLLDTELAGISEIDMSAFGFDMETFAESSVVEEDDYSGDVPDVPRTQLGDLWQLGEHRLICGDSTDIAVIDRLMDGVKADMVFTDPPYNVAFNGRSGKFDVIENDDLSENDFKDLITASCNIIRTLNPKEYYIWCNWKFYGILQEQLDYKSCIVWAKNVFGMGKGYRHQHEFCLFNGTIDEGINNESDLWEIAKDTNYVHPTQKPVALCARALKNHKDANVVVDLFGGSGSTLIACEQLNRKCYMAELDPKYCDVIIQRWEEFTGQKAELIYG